MSVESVLALLVHSRSARQRWRAGTLAVPAALATLDPLAIESTAAAVRRHVLARTHTGVGTLLDAFPHAITAWRTRHPDDRDLDELAAAFLDSVAATRWRETPARTDGISLEEAFYEYACDAQLGDPQARRREWLTALVRMLAVDGTEPAYQLPAYVRRRGGAAWIVDAGDPPTLFATAGGQIVIGPVTTLVVDVLEGAHPAGAEPVRAQLRAMHLVD